MNCTYIFPLENVIATAVVYLVINRLIFSLNLDREPDNKFLAYWYKYKILFGFLLLIYSLFSYIKLMEKDLRSLLIFLLLADYIVLYYVGIDENNE